MNITKPPYSKKHIIVLGSLTLFLAVIALYLQKDALQSDSAPQATLTAEELHDTHTAALQTIQSGDPDKAWARDNLLLFDIRSPQEYNTLHLKGALYMSLQSIPQGVYDPNTTVVLYSDSQRDVDQARQAFAQVNVTNIEVLTESLEDLQAKGYQVETVTESVED